MYRTVDSPTAEKGLVSRVHDGIDSLVDDVAPELHQGTILAGLMQSYQNLLGFAKDLWCNRPEPIRAKSAIILPATTRAPFRQ
jgi:hypothetical protein